MVAIVSVLDQALKWASSKAVQLRGPPPLYHISFVLRERVTVPESPQPTTRPSKRPSRRSGCGRDRRAPRRLSRRPRGAGARRRREAAAEGGDAEAEAADAEPDRDRPLSSSRRTALRRATGMSSTLRRLREPGQDNIETRTTTLNMEDYIFQIEVPQLRSPRSRAVSGRRSTRGPARLHPGPDGAHRRVLAAVRNTPGVTGSSVSPTSLRR